jgi:branched-chain amino acid transport system substrate-binding protein
MDLIQHPRRAFLIICLAFTFLPLWSQQAEPIKIGLLIQDKASLAAKHGAELAIKMANEKGGGNGRPFQLITKDMEGPWGTGSKQAVDLIFENEVWALLGSHDGRNAHLVEQAATKSTVVFLSAWSSDPTLSQAFVPWFFNCVPNDRQQADELIEEIYNKRKFTRVVTIADNAYDSNQALKSFLQSIKLSGKSEPVNLPYNNSARELNVLADQVIKAKANCIVLFCQPSSSLEIIRILQQRKMNEPVFGTLSILNENMLSEKEFREFDNMMSVSSGIWNGSKNMAFRQEYEKLYGKMPGLVAAYAFDGMNLLIEAIRISGGPELEKIQQALSKIRHEGVTGPIRFDSKGNLKGNFAVVKILNGLPVAAGVD